MFLFAILFLKMTQLASCKENIWGGKGLENQNKYFPYLQLGFFGSLSLSDVRVQGQRVSYSVQTVKSTETNVKCMISGYINKL